MVVFPSLQHYLAATALVTTVQTFVASATAHHDVEGEMDEDSTIISMCDESSRRAFQFPLLEATTERTRIRSIYDRVSRADTMASLPMLVPITNKAVAIGHS